MPPRVLVGGRVLDGVGVENSDIRSIPGLPRASPLQPHDLSWQAGHLSHRLLKPQDSFSHVVAEDPGEGPVGPGVGLAKEDPVCAHRSMWVGYEPYYVVLAHGEGDHGGGVAL